MRGLPDHVRDIDLLVHDACRGGGPNARSDNGHSNARDAAKIALVSCAKRLALIHGDGREAAVLSAQEVFAEAFWPEDGETVEV